MSYYSADEINAAIARGATVTATVNDMPRPRQPHNGATVTVTQAFESSRGVTVRAIGWKTRFAVGYVSISGETARDYGA